MIKPLYKPFHIALMGPIENKDSVLASVKNTLSSIIDKKSHSMGRTYRKSRQIGRRDRKITIAINDDTMRTPHILSTTDMEIVREMNDKSLALGSRW
jgi:hypothetical protein